MIPERRETGGEPYASPSLLPGGSFQASEQGGETESVVSFKETEKQSVR